MLKADSLDVYYGPSQVLRGVSVTVAEGERVCVLGRNGVGKTTLLRSIIGLTPPQAGWVSWRGEMISGLPPYVIARRGVGYVPQEKGLFPDLTVEDNLFLAVRDRVRFRKGLAGVRRFFPNLDEYLGRKAGTLSGGQQQYAAIARAVITGPRLLLLDEPTAGIQPSLVLELGSVIDAVARESGCSILLVERNRNLAFRLAERVYILDRGQVVAEGVASELEAAGEVRRYLAF
jgi:ABC-type branched-subunit amino acid transport system ATPase component